MLLFVLNVCTILSWNRSSYSSKTCTKVTLQCNYPFRMNFTKLCWSKITDRKIAVTNKINKKNPTKSIHFFLFLFTDYVYTELFLEQSIYRWKVCIGKVITMIALSDFNMVLANVIFSIVDYVVRTVIKDLKASRY